MYKPLYITVDTIKHITNPIYTVKTNDLNSVKFFITITQDSIPLNLTGAAIRIVYKKPDKSVFFQECTILDAINGSCSVLVDTQAYSISGTYRAEIMIHYDSNIVLITNGFKYISKKGILNTEIISTNQFELMTKTIKDFESLLNDFRISGIEIDAKAQEKSDALNPYVSEVVSSSTPKKVIYTKQDIYREENIDGTASIITNSLVMNYDFTNKKGYKSNSISDTVNNVSATLVNVGHDGITDGFTNDKGLLLKPTGYITIPSNQIPLRDYLEIKNGLTIQIASYNTNGVLFRTDPIEWRLFVSSLIQFDYKYLATDSTTKSHYVQGTQFTNMEDSSKVNYSSVINKRDSNAIDVITVKINPLGSITFYINGSKSTQIGFPPSNFTQFINSLINKSMHIRRNIVALNTNTMTLVGFSVYNRMLTDTEILGNYQAYKKNNVLEDVSILPEVVKLQIGESQTLLVSASPNQYNSQITTIYESGNSGFVTVNSEGLLRGVNKGQTNIKVTTNYKDRTFINYVNVTVGEQILSLLPTPTRLINGISINRFTDTLMVGEKYVVMATEISSALPFDVLNDNIVIWETSNPEVCTVNNGILEGISIGTARITAYDRTKKYSREFTVAVLEPVKKAIPSKEVYIVNPAEYSISLNNTNSFNTTLGIQNALNYASNNAYKKIVFPLGTYLVNPSARTIEIPTEMFVDFSGSRINIEPTTLTSSGYVMFLFNGVKNSTLYNAHIYGEVDSTTISASVEKCISVKFKGGYNSGLESCIISKSPGFNIITENSPVKKGTIGRNISKSSFEPGNISTTGVLDNTTILNYWRSNDYLDLTGLGEYYMLGYNQGYYGYNYLRSRLYSIHFYDSSKAYITSQMYNLQFYNYVKPARAKYAKVVIYQKDPPSSQDNDFSAVAFIRTVDMPKKCFVKNCTIEDNFSTGISICGGEDWIIKGNTFANNKGRMPGCDIDWEDGWENMVGDIATENIFNSPLGVVYSAGSSLALLNNTFNNSCLTIWGRTQNYRIVNNIFEGKGALAITLGTQADSIFTRNILKDTAYSTSKLHVNANYKVHDPNNIIS
ncbi:BppU family phage baseplate upper protein [Peribacillus muralis]|uniref:BppU family phage baseplate upper protein n=1 Tax=Peribacillus muralis TaxID=264697 RepID=UPI00070EAE43|nr:BppU family phage baseplate upper protein [Peribacillus muralis]